MRNSRINAHRGGVVLCKACGQYHSDACTQSEKWTAYRTIQGDYDQGIVLRASQELHSVLISLVFSRKPSRVLAPRCCLMIPIESKGIFSWDVCYLTYAI